MHALVVEQVHDVIFVKVYVLFEEPSGWALCRKSFPSSMLQTTCLDSLNEVIHVHSSLHRLPVPITSSRQIPRVRDPIADDLVNRVSAGYFLECLDNIGNGHFLVVDEFINITDLVSFDSLAALVKRSALSVRLNNQVLLLAILQLVVVKEAHQVTLTWLERDLTCELVDSESLHDIKYVDLQLELLRSVFMEPVLASAVNPAAAAVGGVELAQ